MASLKLWDQASTYQGGFPTARAADDHNEACTLKTLQEFVGQLVTPEK
jgi:hypothetical protein